MNQFNLGDTIIFKDPAHEIYVGCIGTITSYSNNRKYPYIAALLTPNKDGYLGPVETVKEHCILHTITKLERIIWGL